METKKPRRYTTDPFIQPLFAYGIVAPDAGVMGPVDVLLYKEILTKFIDEVIIGNRKHGTSYLESPDEFLQKRIEEEIEEWEKEPDEQTKMTEALHVAVLWMLIADRHRHNAINEPKLIENAPT